MAEALSPKAALLKAADLIEPEGRWTQAIVALDADGHSVMPTDPAAVCWCAVGAIEHILGGPRDGFWDAVYLASDAVGCDIEAWNDDPARTQAEVVTALRLAAEQAP